VSKNEWIEIQNKNHKVRKQNRQTDSKRQQNSYIPVITNRYAPQDIEATKETKLRLENVGNKTKKENMRDRTKKENKTKQKIIIVGDSHARGMAEELKCRLSQEFEIQGIVKPDPHWKD
jgi:hypothetical protein